MAAVLIAGACSTGQPSGGPGWTLVQVRTPTPNREGVVVAALDADAYIVALTVPGKGSDGCGEPRLEGFVAVGSTLVAQIVRSAKGDTCPIVYGITYYVLLYRLQLPQEITAISHNEPCESPGCAGRGVSISSQ
jgi:hypothetical protein